MSSQEPSDFCTVGSHICFHTVAKFISAVEKIRADYNYILNQPILALCQIIHIAWFPCQTINYSSDESMQKSIIFTQDHSFCNLTYYYSRAFKRSCRTKESNFQSVNVPLLSHEGEKADYVCMLDRVRILIYFDTRLPDYFKIESNSV